MIVLDEQLDGRGIDREIARWYAGRVALINELRPNSVIKDEAIPALLSRQSLPTFVTINVGDFWKRAPAGARYCIVCVALPDSRAVEVSGLLRRLVRHRDFGTKSRRMGHVFRLSDGGAEYYTQSSPGTLVVDDW